MLKNRAGAGSLLEDSASGPLLPLGFLGRRPLVDLPDEVVENLQGGSSNGMGRTEANKHAKLLLGEQNNRSCSEGLSKRIELS